MRPELIEKYRSRLIGMRDEITLLQASNDTDRATVELDQQSVGRLSRMDALQRQAMAQETRRRRNLELKRIENALHLMKIDEYGACNQCGEDISEGRLQVDPTAARCVKCAR